MMQTDNSRRTFIRAALAAGATTAAVGFARAAQAQETQSMTKLLDGKAVLVTGAARGIGRAMAEAFADAGANVALLDIADPSAYRTARGYRVANMSEFDAAVASVGRRGGRTLKLVADVRDHAQMERATARAAEAFGGLDVVLANAGFVAWHPFEDGTPAQWQEVFDTNVHGVWNTMHTAIPHLRRRGGGRIIATSSIGGRFGVAGNGAYTASKWAVIGMVKQAAAELGKHNIAVNAVAPGPVDTPMYRSEGQRRSMGAASAADQDRMLAPMLPYGGRAVQDPREIADAAVFLASDAARGISGVSLDVALGFNASYTA
ncbi:MAG: SDR family oxidoreductase [Sphingobium sp.]|uniref:SDR family oxidoreductase n=1 Tax=Sphingobium sp. TaxID=1912891 RepID=UPI002E1C7812